MIVYRVFESLDELVEQVETARGVPMSSSCVVPRGATLDLLDDIREALPAEVHDAQAVLDQRDGLLDDAETRARDLVEDAENRARDQVGDAQAHAQQLVADARAEHERLTGSAHSQAERMVSDGHAEYERLVAAGQAEYDRLVGAGQAEHQRLVAETTVHEQAVAAARQIEADAHAAAERIRTDADSYVDNQLAGFADTLHRTLRSVDGGRASLRSSGAAGWQMPVESTRRAPLR